MKVLKVLCVLLMMISAVPAATITERPVVGAVTTSSAKINVRTSAAADVAIEFADNAQFNNSTTTSEVTTASADDFTTTISLTGLNTDDRYWYRVLVDDVEQSIGTHRFDTFPSSGEYKFAVFADVANQDRTAGSYQKGRQDGALFAVQLGDLNHSNPQTLTAMRSLHRDMRDPANNHGGDFTSEITSRMGLVHIWDDHDYYGNDEDKNAPGREDAWQAFDEYYPTYSRPNAGAGLWHSFACGDAEFFVLDLRSQRDDGNDTDNSDKSMLDGDLITDDQKDWLKNGLDNSTAKWKFILSSVTFNEDARPNSIDLWHSFSTEADELKDYLVDNSIDDVIVLSADIHTGGGIDDGSNSLIGCPEATCPHTNLSGGNRNQKGTWTEGVTNGARGYILVTVSSTAVTIQVKGQNGSVRHSYSL